MNQNICPEEANKQMISHVYNRMTGVDRPATPKLLCPVIPGSFLYILIFTLSMLSSLYVSAAKKQSSSFIHDELKRKYKIYVPSNYDGTVPVPLLLALHGKGGNGESMILLTRRAFNKLAEEDRFLVVYPDGIELNWNDGRIDDMTNDRAHRENIDDVGFLSALIDTMVRHFTIDQGRIYVTGMSNGAIMSYRLACELSHRITAIAPVAGNMTPLLLPGCSLSRHIPVLVINNTDDPVVPFHGGEIFSTLNKVKLGKVMSTEESVLFWVKLNGCLSQPVLTELPDTDPRDGTRVIRKSYTNHSDGTGVILYIVAGGGHTWPGGLQYLPKKLIGKTCRDFNAAEVIWSFFRSQSGLN